jgi:hypothetical protein
VARIVKKGNGHLTALAVSPDGARLAFSDARGVRLLDVGPPPAGLPGRSAPGAAVKRRKLASEPAPAQHLAFSADGRSLLAAAADGALHVLRLEEDGGPAAALHEACVDRRDSGGFAALGAAAGALAVEQLQAAVVALVVRPPLVGVVIASARTSCRATCLLPC